MTENLKKKIQLNRPNMFWLTCAVDVDIQPLTLYSQRPGGGEIESIESSTADEHLSAPAMAAASVSVPRIKLGSQGLEVSAQGLGCLGMSFFYGPPKPEPDMIKLIHHAVATGVTLLDTADMYGPHTNEILLGKVGFRSFFFIDFFGHFQVCAEHV